MEIKLVHSFLKRAHDIEALLENTNKLSTFCNKLEKQAILWPDRYNTDKYKGDGFELFVEALLKLSPIDNRIGIGKYEPILTNDTGVDGLGVGINGRSATVQCKYRGYGYQKKEANKKSLLTATNDHLSNFVVASQNKYGVLVEDTENMLIVTTAKGLHFFTDREMFLGKVSCLGCQQLRDLVNNNILFWDAFRKLVAQS